MTQFRPLIFSYLFANLHVSTLDSVLGMGRALYLGMSDKAITSNPEVSMSSKRPLYVVLASLCNARMNCIRENNTEWQDKHEERIEKLVKEYLPSGSGFDNGTKLDLGKSDGQRLFFNTAFHHMNENGMYDGWTEHTVKVSPSLQFGFLLSISGKDRNDIKDYMYEEFRCALATEIEW